MTNGVKVNSPKEKFEAFGGVGWEKLTVDHAKAWLDSWKEDPYVPTVYYNKFILKKKNLDVPQFGGLFAEKLPEQKIRFINRK